VIVLAAFVLCATAAGSGGSGTRIAFLRHGSLFVLDLGTGKQTKMLAHAPLETIAWSGDGRLLSDGGHIVGRPALPTTALAWAPTGETAAYLTSRGAVDLWAPGVGSRTILGAGWGATSLAWGGDGELALGRAAGGIRGVWLWRAGLLTRVARASGPFPRPIVAGVDGRGRVLWWNDLQGSASIAADGLELYANATPIAQTLVFPDYVQVCGSGLAVAAGTDRYTTRAKRILFEGRDISRDASLSWVSPSCSAGGLLVAAAGRNWYEPRIGEDEDRAIWELRPDRAQLTHPPAGWTDENPRILPDGSIMFIRTRETSVKLPGHWTTPTGGRTAAYVPGGWRTTDHGRIELLSEGRLAWIASTSWSTGGYGGSYVNYYGHYGWPWLVAVSP
jgi:hypothetical protein